MTAVKLEFSFDKAITLGENKLQNGKIILTHDESKTAYLATSGLAGYQSPLGARVRGRGRIPSCSQAGLTCYQMATTPIYMPRVKGVEGNFYPITPFTVKVDGHSRADFGLHFDPVPGTPGSAGCIVIRNKEHWDKIQSALRAINAKGVNTIPLYVA